MHKLFFILGGAALIVALGSGFFAAVFAAERVTSAPYALTAMISLLLSLFFLAGGVGFALFKRGDKSRLR